MTLTKIKWGTCNSGMYTLFPGMQSVACSCMATCVVLSNYLGWQALVILVVLEAACRHIWAS